MQRVVLQNFVHPVISLLPKNDRVKLCHSGIKSILRRVGSLTSNGDRGINSISRLVGTLTSNSDRHVLYTPQNQCVKVAHYGAFFLYKARLFRRAIASQIYLCPAKPDINIECWLATARQEKIARLLNVNRYNPK